MGSPLEVYRQSFLANETTRNERVRVPERVVAQLLVVKTDPNTAVAFVAHTNTELALGDHFRGAQRVAGRPRASYPGSSPVPGSSRLVFARPCSTPRIPRTRSRLRPWLALQQRALLPARSRRRACCASTAIPSAHCARAGSARLASATSTRRSRLPAPRARGGAAARLAARIRRASRATRIPRPLLLVQGDAAALARPASRSWDRARPPSTASLLAREFAGALARAGLVVISGLARGIDAAAHAGALEAGGRTVAVQACGPDLVYPAAHRELASRIARQGALLTEFPPGTPPRPAHFPLRNRLISGLAEALLVIEARERSGTLVTTAHAAAQGVDVFALPGPLGAAACAGSNRLLRDGAHVALEPEDVLGVLRLGGLRLEPLGDPSPRRGGVAARERRGRRDPRRARAGARAPRRARAPDRAVAASSSRSSCSSSSSPVGFARSATAGCASYRRAATREL